jgi:hypothetical protein
MDFEIYFLSLFNRFMFAIVKITCMIITLEHAVSDGSKGKKKIFSVER